MKAPARTSAPFGGVKFQLPKMNERLWTSNGKKNVSPALWKPFRGTLPKRGDADWNWYNWPEYVVLEDQEHIDRVLQRFANPAFPRRLAKHHIKKFVRNFDSEGYVVDPELTAGLGPNSLPLKHEDVFKLREARARLASSQEQSEDEEYKASILAGFAERPKDSDSSDRREAIETATTAEEPMASDTALEAQLQLREDSVSTAMSLESTSLPDTALEFHGQQQKEDTKPGAHVGPSPVPEMAPGVGAMQRKQLAPLMIQVSCALYDAKVQEILTRMAGSRAAREAIGRGRRVS